LATKGRDVDCDIHADTILIKFVFYTILANRKPQPPSKWRKLMMDVRCKVSAAALLDGEARAVI
jgi:hypothetical protein